MGKRTPLISPAARIVIVVEKNPKREGTRAHQKFSELKSGMTVAEFYALEGQRPTLDAEKKWPQSELRWSLRKGFVRLEG